MAWAGRYLAIGAPAALLLAAPAAAGAGRRGPAAALAVGLLHRLQVRHAAPAPWRLRRPATPDRVRRARGGPESAAWSGLSIILEAEGGQKSDQ